MTWEEFGEGMGLWGEECVDGVVLMGTACAGREVLALMWALHWIREVL